MIAQSPGDFVAVIPNKRQPKIRLGPEILANQNQSVAEGRSWLGVSSSAPDGAGLPLGQLVRQQGDQEEEADEGGGGAGDSRVGLGRAKLTSRAN